MFNLFSLFKRDYNRGFTSVMGVFSRAKRRAVKLMSKMEKEVNANNDAINKLQERNADIERTYNSVERFASNLDNLLGV